MNTTKSRRAFLSQTGRYAGAIWVVGSRVRADDRKASETLNLAIVGVGGRGANNLREVSDQNIVALCDVDSRRLGEASKGGSKAKSFADFRVMFDELHEQIDAVVVSTPDHTHAVVALAAIQLGKHVYCEKPLTHSIREARAMTEAAAKAKVATQMGNAGHSSENTRRVVEIVRSGAIGDVKEVHAWTNRPIWPQGIDRPASHPAVPPYLNWDLWLGPAPERPYHPDYHPFKWRGWWDFGTGALGDMGCHVLDPPYWALDLKWPERVEAQGPSGNKETAPAWSIVKYHFPARGDQPPVALTWYDGGKLPPMELFDDQKPTPGSSGSVLVGAKGRLLVRHGGGGYRLLPEGDFKDFKTPEETIPRSKGHHREWLDACKSGGATGTNFSYAGPLTETILLGNVALHSGRAVDWDGAAAKPKGGALDDLFIERAPRKGWS